MRPAHATKPRSYSALASSSSVMRTPVPSHMGQTTSSPLASCVNPVPSQLGQSIDGMGEAPFGLLAAPARGTGAAGMSRTTPRILARLRGPELTDELLGDVRCGAATALARSHNIVVGPSHRDGTQP